MTNRAGHGATSSKTVGSPSNTSLREKKKAETKEAIVRAAAHVLLRDGAEALTVAHVAQTAGVSPRTFHNYFQSMEEALLWFIHLHGAEITEAFAQVPAEYSVVEAARAVFVVNSDAGADTSAATETSTGTGEQSSMVALMHVVQQVAAMPNISAAKYAFEEDYGDTSPHLLADALAARMPNADQFTIHTYDWLIGAAIASAVDEYTAARSSARSCDVDSSADSGATKEKNRPELNSLLNRAFDALKMIH
ncbi:TetR/AcrR family transcriptional regulator [Corynebacterium pseudodiphtheriticum]|uniref:TetR/AcrR family transcriptional regulator n=1 Tax=Corynebacterium pseudodiphtheriticum TaxID=37637 RepID=UPI002542BF34|nr:TetR/AcrR family transcriptional regulator [Corynebacterium pseudodiphtheriticum]MDK4242446.1 TetR/AcrR family transcriptional regulator [Corynebacterium pseudodiphtheriticum]MDK4277394.1 TetR/AcrR family transcriptional regulator [Corynebacterium pseudodiphtheriticum]MDK4296111.1 TetR/AcrR family transcriptional regulator [Corynebacterium pseudodiphtheriticum]MDK4316831.1 TetR/AcrR family transcriptional regulator [Corynebacterium pseudodiphtheriticum]